jgi:hypothetical protein
VGAVVLPASDFVKLLQNQKTAELGTAAVSEKAGALVSNASLTNISSVSSPSVAGGNTDGDDTAGGQHSSTLDFDLQTRRARSFSLGALRAVQFIHAQGKFSDNEKRVLIADIINGHGNVVKAYTKCNLHGYGAKVFVASLNGDVLNEDTDDEGEYDEDEDDGDIDDGDSGDGLDLLTMQKANEILAEFERLCRGIVKRSQ